MYQLVTGPLLWLSFGIFFIGVTVRVVRYIRGLNWQMDRVTYRANVSYGIKGALRSIFFWLFPFGTVIARINARVIHCSIYMKPIRFVVPLRLQLIGLRELKQPLSTDFELQQYP